MSQNATIIVDKLLERPRANKPVYPHLSLALGDTLLIRGMRRQSGQRLVASWNAAHPRLYRARTVADGVIVTRHA